MPTIVNLDKVKHICFRETPNDAFKTVKKAYEKGSGALVFSASQPITYKADTNKTYTEEVDYGASALAPTSFTPTKSGYTFVGWRMDTTASSSVLTEKTVDDESFTLYAVFKKTITVSYNGNGATSGSTASQTGVQYYNNGFAANPSFKLASNGYTKTSYTFIKWAKGSASGTQYAAGASVALSEDTTFYASWIASAITINYAVSASYPYVATGGEYSSTDGWTADHEDEGDVLWLADLATGYINKAIDLTYYKTLSVTVRGPWYNHKGNLTFGVGAGANSTNFAASASVYFNDKGGSVVTGSLDISAVTGSGYIKFNNLANYSVDIRTITLSV